MMSRLTAEEIAIWMGLAALAGVVLGAVLNELWRRRRERRKAAKVEAQQRRQLVEVAEPAPPPPEPSARRIKGKVKSKIYHVPGSPAYDRTRADVWFDTEDEARAAGYREPKNASGMLDS